MVLPELVETAVNDAFVSSVSCSCLRKRVGSKKHREQDDSTGEYVEHHWVVLLTFLHLWWVVLLCAHSLSAAFVFIICCFYAKSKVNYS